MIYDEKWAFSYQKRGKDGNRIISIRINEETFEAIDKLSAETNHSRNELINIILAHGVKNIEIQKNKSSLKIVNDGEI